MEKKIEITETDITMLYQRMDAMKFLLDTEVRAFVLKAKIQSQIIATQKEGESK